MDAQTAKAADYIYCEDCGMFVDFYKYAHDIEDAGHNGCNWRFVTEEELAGCIKDCEELIERCPECDALLDFELAKCMERCQCGWKERRRENL